MKKLLIIAYIVTGLWAIFCLLTYADSISNDIANEGYHFALGYILGMFVTTFSPIGAVMAYTGYSQRQERKKLE